MKSKHGFQHEINHAKLGRGVTFIKYLARTACFICLTNVLICNDAFPASNSLNLPKLGVDEIKRTFSVYF